MQSIKVSVVIPYFNDSIVIDRTLNSVISQTYLPYEIIIVDDCSDDSLQLQKIIASYNFNIRYFRNTQNKNGAFSRNFGIQQAKSDVIALLDADDFWDENHLKFSLDALEKMNSDFVYSNYIKHKHKDIKVKVTNVNILKNKNDILFFSPPQTNSFVFKKRIFDEKKINFDEKLRRHQDWQFFIQAVNSNIKISYSDQYTSYYCVSNRPRMSRINYDSMFRFWAGKYFLFSPRPLKIYLLNIALNCRVDEGYDRLKSILEKYNLNNLIDDNKLFFFYMRKMNSKVFLKLVFYMLYSRKEFFLKLLKIIRGNLS